MPGLNRSMTTTATCGKVASGVNQTLKQALALSARSDDLLGVLIVDPLIRQCACHVISNETHMCLQVQRRRDQTQRAGFAGIVSGVVVDVFGDQSESRV